MDNLKNIVKSHLEDGIELMDLVYDSRSDYVRVVVDSFRDISIGKTSNIAKRIRNDESILSMFPNGCKLEVGTPGVGISLTRKFQYKKNIGRKFFIYEVRIVLTIRMISTILTRPSSFKSANSFTGIDPKTIFTV